MGLPRCASGKESISQCKRRRRRGFDPWVRKIPWSRKWHPTSVLLPGKSHGRRSLVGCGLWGRYESDTTKRLHFPFSLSCTGEGNGNPLQCSCLENPRDGGAWWAAVYGVAQSRTRLKWLSSSSSKELLISEPRLRKRANLLETAGISSLTSPLQGTSLIGEQAQLDFWLNHFLTFLYSLTSRNSIIF